MKKLLLAVAMGAGFAAPAFAQSAATNQPERYHNSAPSVQARNVMQYGTVPQPSINSGTYSSDLAAQQAYQDSTSDPRNWKASNPFNYNVPGG